MRENNTFFNIMTPVVTHILIINVLAWLATYVCETNFGIDLNQIFALHYYTATDFHSYQFVTYMFMHGGFDHLFFNMFSLFMFGCIIEKVLGTKRFISFYLISGIGAGLVQELFWTFDPNVCGMLNELERLTNAGVSVKFSETEVLTYGEFLVRKEVLINAIQTVGASGAVFALLLAFGMIFPNQKIYFYFFIPIKAKYFVIGYALLELFLGVGHLQSGIAHFAHLGGMIFGFMLLKIWKIRSQD